MKALLLGVAFIVLVGIAGFLYRNAVSKPVVPIGTACTAEAKVCPDGSAVGRVAPSCNFAPCPAPNVTLASAGIVFALPAGYVADDNALGGDATLIGDYVVPASGSTGDVPPTQSITIHDYPIPAGKAAGDVMHATAIGDASGAPVSPSAFSAAYLGSYTFSYVTVGRFEGVVHQSYYLLRGSDVLRFDALDRGVANWTDSNLDLTKLPANAALRAMLTTMQTNQ